MVPGWLDELEQEVARCLTGGCRLSPRGLADALERTAAHRGGLARRDADEMDADRAVERGRVTW